MSFFLNLFRRPCPIRTKFKNANTELNILNKWLDEVPFRISKHENSLDLENLDDPFMKNIVKEIQDHENSVKDILKIIEELEEEGGNILSFSDVSQLQVQCIGSVTNHNKKDHYHFWNIIALLILELFLKCCLRIFHAFQRHKQFSS